MGASRSRKDLGRRLLELKEQLEKEKAERAELQGEFRSVMNQLKEDFDVNDLDQADERIKEAEESLKAMNKSIRDKIEELEEMMGRHG